MPNLPYILLGVAILALLVVLILAIRRGRNINVHMEKGNAKFGLEVNGPEAPEPRETAAEGAGNISDVSILNQGQVRDSNNMNIHVGHSSPASSKKE
jgi:hypothetical protein